MTLTLSRDKIPIDLLNCFIIFAPLEHVIRIEQLGYVLLIGAFLLLYSKIHLLKRGLKLNLVFFTIYILMCCAWSPAANVVSAVLVKFVVFLFLILAVQFDYTEADYSIIKRAFVIQGAVLVILCLAFGSFQDGRLWISTASSGSDPNYLSTWFIFPLIYSCDELIHLKKIVPKIAIIAQIISMYACVFLTASRSGFVTNALAASLYLIYSFRHIMKKKPLRAMGLIIFFILGCVIAVKAMPNSLVQRLTQTNSMGVRGKAWKQLLSTMNDNWLMSIIGFGDSATMYHNTQGMIYGYASGGLVAHNTYLEIMFNNGVIGIVSFIILIVGGIINRIREFRIEIVIGTCCMCIALFTLTALSTRPVSFMLLLLLIDIKSENQVSNSIK